MTKNWYNHVVYGFIYGDAFGFFYEDKTKEELADVKRVSFQGFGKYLQPEGTYSWESSFLLATLTSLNHGFHLDELMSEYCAVVNYKTYTATDATFNVPKTIERACASYENGVKPSLCGVVLEKNNEGTGLLRTLAFLSLGLAFDQEDFESYLALTDATPSTIVASLFYIKLLSHAKAGASLAQAIEKSFSELINQYRSEENQKRLALCLQIETAWEKKDFTLYPIHSSFYYLFTALDCVEKESSMNRLASSIVHYGGNTSELLALAYSIVYAFDGKMTLPEEWTKIQNHEQIDKILSKIE